MGALPAEQVSGVASAQAAEPADSPVPPWLLLFGAVFTAGCLGVLFALIRHDWAFWMIDFEVYRLGASAVLHGESLYAAATAETNLVFTYSPLSALLFVPLLALPFPVMAVVWTAVEVLFLELAVWLTLGAAGLRQVGTRAVATVLVSGCAMFLSAVDNDLSLGQINLLLMFLVLVDLLHGDGKRWQGVCIGLAAAIKLIPLIYIGYLAVTGRLRAAGTALGVFALCASIGFLLLPSDSVSYWTGTAVSADRIGAPDNLFNQSLRAMLARITHNPETFSVLWLVVAAVTAVAGLAAAAMLHRDGHRLRAVLVCALTTLLVAPVSWEHHWVWVVPLLILIGAQAWRQRSLWWAALLAGATAVFGLRLLDLAMPPPGEADAGLDEVRKETADKLGQSTTWLDHLLPNSIVLSGIALLVILAAPALRPRPGDAANPPEGRRADVAGSV